MEGDSKEGGIYKVLDLSAQDEELHKPAEATDGAHNLLWIIKDDLEEEQTGINEGWTGGNESQSHIVAVHKAF